MINKSNPWSKDTATPEGEKMVPGIDVSHYQNGIKWGQVAAAGKKFAYCKASDGAKGRDSSFAAMRKGAQASGLITGAYHFLRFNDDPTAQALNFFEATGGVLPGELPPMLDVEWDRYSPKYHEGSVMDFAAAEMVKEFLASAKNLFGQKPGIYTNYYFWSCAANDRSKFASYPLWVPNYHATKIEDVKIPAPWAAPTFWQNSETGHLGEVEAVDLDWFLGTEEELRALCKQ